MSPTNGEFRVIRPSDTAEQSVTLSDQLQDLVLETPEIEDFLEELAGVMAFSVPDGQVVCGVTLLRREAPVTVASSAPEARELDEMQYASKWGPCLEAAKTGTTTYVHDIRSDTRWPDYFAAIHDHRYFSVLAVPMQLVGQGRAAVNLYARTPGTFTPELVRDIERDVAQSAKVLRLSLLVADHVARSTHLAAAMESRTAIDIAVGIVVAQNRCSQADAIEILGRASNNRNMKLRDLATELIRSTSGGVARTHFT